MVVDIGPQFSTGLPQAGSTAGLVFVERSLVIDSELNNHIKANIEAHQGGPAPLYRENLEKLGKGARRGWHSNRY